MMKKLMCLAAIFAVFACGGGSKVGPSSGSGPSSGPEGPSTGPGDGPTAIATPAFAKGADISWASEMEAGGRKFKKKDGTSADLLSVLADCGVNAIRLRVWVDPYKGYSGKADVVAMARRATAAGLALMIDFHYSDFFADPSRQQIPAAWVADKADIGKMVQHVSDHTTEVLQALKDGGVQVHWVQVGNETRNGILWPAGQLWTDSGDIADGRKHFAQLYNAGYDAVKAIYPSALVMPHLNNAYDDNDWWFQQIKAAGGKFDAIALSHYPQAESQYTAAQYNQKALDRIKALHDNYKIPVIVSEVGVKTFAGEAEAKRVLQSFLTEVRKVNGVTGVFYWEPEVDGQWKPAVYGDAAAIKKYTDKSETWNAYSMGAFTTTGAPTSVMDVFAD